MIKFLSGFPPLAQRNDASQNIADLQRRLSMLQTELATGRVSDQAAALGGKSSEALLTESRIALLGNLKTNIGFAIGRADTQQAALSSIGKSLGGVVASAQSALSSPLDVGFDALAAEARLALDGVVGALNASYAGRGLFSGDSLGPSLASASDIRAVAVSAFTGAATPEAGIEAIRDAFDTPGMDFDSSLYLGGGGSPPATELENGATVRIDLRADSPSIRSVVRDIASLAAVSDPALGLTIDERRQGVEDALRHLRKSLVNLEGKTVEVGIVQARLEQSSTRILAEEATLSAFINETIGKNIENTAANISNSQLTLESLLLTTAKISNIKLSNFIN